MGNPLMPAVTVNGQKIPSAAIAAEAQNHAAPKGKPGLAWRAAARALVVRELLLQAAARAGVTATPEKLDETRIETEEDALIRAWLEQALEIREITEADITRAYQANPARYRSPDLFEASHILLAAKPNDAEAREAAREAAEGLLQTLLENPDRFAELARKNSDCPSGQNGGQLGQLRAGDTVAEFEAALRTLEVGEIAPEPVESRFGIHVLRLDQRASGKTLPLEAVRDRIREDLEKAAWASAARDLVNELVNAAEIEGIDLKGQSHMN